MNRRIAIVLQTPRDPQSSVFLIYQTLAGELTQRGCAVAMVTPDDLLARRAGGRWTPLVYPLAVRRWVHAHRNDLDLVVFHSYAGWLAAPATVSGEVKTVVAFHGLEPLYHQELLEEMRTSTGLSWRYRMLQERLMPVFLRRSCQHATGVACLNSAERAYLRAHGWARSDRIWTFAHGVPDEFFASARMARPVRTLLYVGQWLPMKGVKYLRDAFTQLSPRHPDIRLVCAGTLTDAAAVVSAFPPAIRSRIAVHPRAERAALAALYQEADVFLFPSLYEGFGMALLEAMAARLPIVTTQVGVAIDALTHEESAILVGKRDAPAIVDAVARLDGDQTLRGRLGDAAHAVALTYRADDRTRELANWIQRLG